MRSAIIAAVLFVAGLIAIFMLAAAAGCSSSSPAVEPVKPAHAASTVALPAPAQAHNPITTTKVVRARLAGDVLVVGSVSFDQDHYAVVGPLVAGRVARLRASVGDSVRAGEVLCEIESAEVGQAQAAYLAAGARARAAEANARRERELAAQKISSVREQEVAEASAVSEAAEVRAATERLRAFGLAAADVAALDKGTTTAGRVPLRAPIAGTVIARSVTLGQAVERATDAFKIVDLAHLWVLLDLHEKDVERVHVGQRAELSTDALPGQVLRARVAYVNPLIDERTRTAHVRIEFDNPKGQLHPGQFVTARLVGDPEHAAREVLAVARRALQTVDGKSLVFKKTAAGTFEKHVVEIGPSSGELVEVRSGVVEGDELAADGAFLLKSELLR